MSHPTVYNNFVTTHKYQKAHQADCFVNSAVQPVPSSWHAPSVAQPHPDDDEQLQDGDEQQKAPQNHAGGAWSPRENRGNSNLMRSEMRSQSSRAWVRMEKRRLPEAGMDVSRKGETAKVPLLRPLAVGSEFQGDHQHPRAAHQEAQYTEHAARISKGKGTKPRRDARAAGRAKEGRSDVCASTGKRGTTTHDLRVCPSRAGKWPLRRTSRTETHERTPTIPHPHNRKKQGKKRLTYTTTAHFHPLRSAAPGPQARLRAQRRDAHAVVLRWSRVVVTEEEVALAVVEGRFTRKERPTAGWGSQRESKEKKNRGKELGGVGMGGRKSGACGAQMRRSRVKAQAPRTRSKQWRESTVGVRRGTGGRGEDGWTTRVKITKEARSGWWRGKVARRKRSKVARTKDAMEERRRCGS
ncbi:hypothetical protein B0H13DRAFT_1913080 [Mycena leptocephala]|nr:hypothetical protein B0H13DRAFT_1913080 [Mycena leptocephala]